MIKEFIIVEYMKCPHCGMTFDPRGMVVYEDTDTTIIECRFCAKTAPLNLTKKETRI